MTALPPPLAALGARAPRDSDASFLARLYASTRPDLLGDGSADPVFASALIAMQQRLQGADYRARFPHADTWLLERAGAPYARIVVERDALRIRLVDIAVLPEARGQGAGTRILLALQQWAGDCGVPLQLAVHAGNPRARRLYLALGFVADGAAADQLCWRLS